MSSTSKKLESQWEDLLSQLASIYSSNDTLEFNEQKSYVKAKLSTFSETELNTALEDSTSHKENIERNREVLDHILEQLGGIINAEHKKKIAEPKTKQGRSFWTSPYNVSDSITTSSDVSFRLRQRGTEDEWIQCEVIKVLGDGTRFEVRDPEPDENNNPGKTYKASWKDVILIASEEESQSLISYPYGTKVLARYPETTTFYPAVVIGTKRDGRCRLRFDGEDEEDKETEVARRLVLPYPAR